MKIILWALFWILFFAVAFVVLCIARASGIYNRRRDKYETDDLDDGHNG